MTLVRKLALKISDAVVAFASPGSKEWAEGLTSEVPFIEGDWAALGWAIGSIRILLDYREAPIISIDDLNSRARRFAELKRNAHARWIWMLVWLVIFNDRYFHAANSMERTGWSMATLGYLFVTAVGFMEWRKRREVPENDDSADCSQFYVADLKRRCNIYLSAKWWFCYTSATLICAGLLLGYREGQSSHVFSDVATGLFWVGLTLLFLKPPKNIRRHLEQAEALLSENS